jgi:hypothetical protein
LRIELFEYRAGALFHRGAATSVREFDPDIYFLSVATPADMTSERGNIDSWSENDRIYLQIKVSILLGSTHAQKYAMYLVKAILLFFLENSVEGIVIGKKLRNIWQRQRNGK